MRTAIHSIGRYRFDRVLACTNVFIASLHMLGCTAASSGTVSASLDPGTLSFSPSAVAVTQGSGAVNLTVSRSTGVYGAVSAPYSTSDGTAVASVDYAATSGTLSWRDGDSTTRQIAIPLIAGTPFYGTRVFTVSLSSVNGGAALGTGNASVTIAGSATSPASAGVLAFMTDTVSVPQTASDVTFAVTRTGGTAGTVGVAYFTSNGTAVAGTDYTATNGSLTWMDGDATTKSITVPIRNVDPYSGTHTFTLNLASVSGGATLGTISTITVNVTGSWYAPSSYPQFHLSNWKLTLPIDKYGGTGGMNGTQYEAATIQPAQLAAGFVDAYFYADALGNLLFTAPSNGATTTPGSGSDHTRSELRELYTGSGADNNSDWNSSIGGILAATCEVKAVSVDSDEATIGQIHGQSYVFMLITYHPKTSSVVVSLYKTNTSTSAYGNTTLLTGVALGDTLSYTIQYVGSTLTTTVQDVTRHTAIQTLVLPIDSSWTGSPVYFKAGAYHAAPNLGNPVGDQTQVSFSSLTVSH